MALASEFLFRDSDRSPPLVASGLIAAASEAATVLRCIIQDTTGAKVNGLRGVSFFLRARSVPNELQKIVKEVAAFTDAARHLDSSRFASLIQSVRGFSMEHSGCSGKTKDIYGSSDEEKLQKEKLDKEKLEEERLVKERLEAGKVEQVKLEMAELEMARLEKAKLVKSGEVNVVQAYRTHCRLQTTQGYCALWTP